MTLEKEQAQAMGAVWRVQGKQVAVKQLHSKDVSHITAAAFARSASMALLKKEDEPPKPRPNALCCWDREPLLMSSIANWDLWRVYTCLPAETPESLVSRAYRGHEVHDSGGVLKRCATGCLRYGVHALARSNHHSP